MHAAHGDGAGGDLVGRCTTGVNTPHVGLAAVFGGAEQGVLVDPHGCDRTCGGVERAVEFVADPTVGTSVGVDQTDLHGLQVSAADSGKKRIILMIFDGLDWTTTRTAAKRFGPRWTH